VYNCNVWWCFTFSGFKLICQRYYWCSWSHIILDVCIYLVVWTCSAIARQVVVLAPCMWVDCGRPRNDVVANLIRRMVSLCHKRCEEKWGCYSSGTNIADAVLDNEGRNFWVENKRIRSNKASNCRVRGYGMTNAGGTSYFCRQISYCGHGTHSTVETWWLLAEWIAYRLVYL